jgi:hypothetical protein
MISHLKKYPYTSGAVALTLIGLAIVFGFNLEMAEYLITALEYLEVFEADELLLGAILIALGILVDLRRTLQRTRVETIRKQERIKTLQSTIRTVHDIVNNFLNSLLLFKCEAEESEALPPASLNNLENLIFTTAQKLKRLGDLKTIVEREIGPGLMTIDVDASEKNV